MKETFKVEKDGKEVEFAVISPKSSDNQKADVIQGRVFKEAVDNDVLFRAKLDSHMKKQGLWIRFVRNVQMHFLLLLKTGKRLSDIFFSPQ